MKHGWGMAVMLGAAALMGCSSDDDPQQAFCSGFGNGATFQWAPCTNCTVASQGNASDGNLATEAAVVPNAGVTSETFVITATSVNPIAGGAVVGAWVTQPSTLTGFTTDFETFLNGTPREELDVNPQTGNGVVIGTDEGTPAGGFIGMRTTLEFDQVRFTRTNQFNAGADPIFRVYEICSDGGNS